MNKHHVLIIESNDWDREQVSSCLRSLERPVRILTPEDIDAATGRIDVIILGFSDAVALETSRAQLEKARGVSPGAQLILCAPREMPDLDSRILELKARAFLLKPIDEDTFAALMVETLGQIQLRHERAEYARATRKASSVTEIIGDSDAIRGVLSLLERVAESASTSVLLLGESGVGKSLFAQTTHELCTQANGPFIEINCATLPTQLLESELFGYEPGAFTDAKGQKIGLIELAHGGTLFLDEITEIDLVTQAKLLKFLDTKRFRRLGGDVEIEVETRIVAASNRDIREEVRQQNFREDLFYRLNVVEVNIPPLRERREDIAKITAYYLDYYRRKFKKPRVTFTDDARQLLNTYDWPGNVRELINVLERAILLAPNDEIDADDIPVVPVRARSRRARVTIRDTVSVEFPDGGVSLDALERAAIEAALGETRGNVSRAAELLGVSRGALRNKLSKHKIDARAFARMVPVG